MNELFKVYLFAFLKRLLKVSRKVGLLKKATHINFQKRFVDLGEVTIRVKDLWGMKMLVNVMDVGFSHSLILRKEYEKVETKLFKKILKKGNIFVDVGANFGYYSLLASRKVGKKGKVFAFEPDPYNFEVLKKNIELNNFKNVVCVNKAVVDKEKTFYFYISYDLLGDQNFIKDVSRKRVLVKGKPLDMYFGRKKKVDIVKVDVQGAEEMVIKGMEKTIGANPKMKILIEFCPEWIEKNGLKPMNFLKLINRLHLSIFFVDDLSKSQDNNSVLEEAKKRRGLNLLLAKL